MVISFSSRARLSHTCHITTILLLIFLLSFTTTSVVYSLQLTKIVLNGSEAILECSPAENLVRTHMAPDFEKPQLIRSLEWFLEDSIVASYQQDIVRDSAKQWWVSDGRLQLIRPFYSLHISPSLPHDSGLYHCHLETDPLFALAISTGSIMLIVKIRPPAPSKPDVTSVSQRFIALSWKVSSSEAHKPLLRQSVLVKNLSDKSEGLIILHGNTTSTNVTNLIPLTSYAFSVQAENAAGISNYSPITTHKTLGEALTSPPVIQYFQNTSDECVKVKWSKPYDPSESIVGYRIIARHMSSNTVREWYTDCEERILCGLPFNSAFRISIEADNGYGYSPSASDTIYTDESTPSGPPLNLWVNPFSAHTVHLAFDSPEQPNGVVVAYKIYFKREKDTEYQSMMMKVDKRQADRFSYNISNLDAYKMYFFSVSALTMKGEGDRSDDVYARTDHDIPTPPKIFNITSVCPDSVTVTWGDSWNYTQYYHLLLAGNLYKSFNTTVRKVKLLNLTLDIRYSIKVSSVVRSILNDSTISSQWSKTEFFIIHDQCILYSSVCASKTCKLLSLPLSSSSSLIYLILAFFFVGLLPLLIVVLSKSRIVKLFVFGKKELKEDIVSNTAQSFPCVTTIAQTVSVEFFGPYCDQMSKNDNSGFRKQFDDIERDLLIIDEQNSDDHRFKDRYLNICALEQTRIKLLSHNSDYINANYIDSCESTKAFIATQAPLPHTFADFWEMVWQEHSNVIVVITNLVEHGRRKCDQYWPGQMNTSQTYHHFIVTLDHEQSNAHFVHRHLTLKMSKRHSCERKIHQVQFVSWPDHGVPSTVFPLLSFLEHVSRIDATGPIVVHCSAGIGRSGSYLLIESMRRHLKFSEKLCIEGHLKHMRQQRAKLVQTLDQYIFCHEAIRHLITHGITRVPVKRFMNYIHYLFHETHSNRTHLQIQFEELCKCTHTPPCIVPNGYQTFCGYHREDEFIVATWPKENQTLWQLVWEKSCQTIVLMGEENCFWTGLETAGDLAISRNGRDGESWILSNQEDQLFVRIITVSQCDFELDTWLEIERAQKRRLQYHDGPLLILNYQNTSMAYILCVLTSAACQLESESCLDVVQFLSSFKDKLCGVWRTQCDIEIIYDKLLILVQKRYDVIGRC